MRCLSIRAPWAFMIIHLPGPWKDVENRSRNTLHRGPLLVHASGTLLRAEHEEACEWARAAGAAAKDLPTLATLERLRGHVLGAVRLFDVSAPGYELDDRPSSPWRNPDCFAYHLADRVALPRRPLLGKLGVFEVPATPAELALLRAAGLA